MKKKKERLHLTRYGKFTIQFEVGAEQACLIVRQGKNVIHTTVINKYGVESTKRIIE